jgi:hypothetical protein
MGVKVQVPNDILRHEIMFWMSDNLTKEDGEKYLNTIKLTVELRCGPLENLKSMMNKKQPGLY